MALKRLLVCCLGLVLVAGCDTPSAPGPAGQAPTLSDYWTVDESDAELAPGPSALGGLARFDRAPAVPEIEIGRIGPEGGRLSLGDFEVIVPPGAVDGSTLFKIRRPPDPISGQSVVVELFPHNVTFKVPVTIRLPLNGTTADGGDPGIVVWTDGDWIPYPSVLIDGGRRIETTTLHFSFWAVWADIGELSSGG